MNEFPWRFEICKQCGRNNVVGFRVTDSMWERVTDDMEGVLCIWCFDEMAAAKDIDWTEEPVEFYAVSTVANRKWAQVEVIREAP